LSVVVWLLPVYRPNMSLKRDAPFRGGFESLLFFWLRWLRQSSVTGAPLSFTLGNMKTKQHHPTVTRRI